MHYNKIRELRQGANLPGTPLAPQTKIKTTLTRILAVDPTKDLPFLRRRQLARTAGPFA
jgi:hypothetical protein